LNEKLPLSEFANSLSNPNLGTGLDTFAYRQPLWGSSLTIYEVDHPITQRCKQDRLKAAVRACYLGP
jgi:hypothetical protein